EPAPHGRARGRDRVPRALRAGPSAGPRPRRPTLVCHRLVRGERLGGWSVGRREAGPGSDDLRHDPLEVVGGAELDDDAAPLLAHLDRDPSRELLGQDLLDLGERGLIGRGRGLGGGLARGRGVLEVRADELFDLADRQLLGGRAEGERALGLLVTEREQGPTVSRLDPALREELLNLGGEREQADGVRDVRPGDPEALRQRLLLEAELLQQLSERLGELDRVQVLPVDVLDQRLAEGVRVVALAYDRGDGRESRQAGRAQAPLPRDELVSALRAPHDDRLQDPDLANRHRQRLQRLVLEARPWLTRVGRDAVQGDLEQRRPFLHRPGNQGGQTPPQPASLHRLPPRRNRLHRRLGREPSTSSSAVEAAGAGIAVTGSIARTLSVLEVASASSGPGSTETSSTPDGSVLSWADSTSTALGEDGGGSIVEDDSPKSPGADEGDAGSTTERDSIAGGPSTSGVVRDDPSPEDCGETNEGRPAARSASSKLIRRSSAASTVSPAPGSFGPVLRMGLGAVAT